MTREDHMNERLVLGSPVDGVLDRLYALQGAQHDGVVAHFMDRAADASMNWEHFDERTNTFLRDKLVALDRDKAEFCYHVCRALRARRVVEAGTSFGVSTLFLAAAVRDNHPGGSGRRDRDRVRAREGPDGSAALRRGRSGRRHRPPRRRSAGNARGCRRADRFHAGRYLDVDGPAGALADCTTAARGRGSSSPTTRGSFGRTTASTSSSSTIHATASAR
jgi:hypothetical protein